MHVHDVRIRIGRSRRRRRIISAAAAAVIRRGRRIVIRREIGGPDRRVPRDDDFLHVIIAAGDVLQLFQRQLSHDFLPTTTTERFSRVAGRAISGRR
jgi:hypothetical protein